jgi:hypothetical protein
MEGCDEVVVTCSKDDAAIHVWNPSTAQHLKTFKNNTSGRPNAWSLVGQHHMLAIQEARPSIHVWSWARVRPSPPPNNLFNPESCKWPFVLWLYKPLQLRCARGVGN